MIPVKLSLRNFMCYRGDGVELDLEGVHLACLSGENGAGKSALLAAITWALWGRARDGVKSDEELITQSANEMEVDYEFVLGGSRYRVVRKLARKKSAILELHLQAADTGVWHPLTGHHVRDTQEKIIDLLKMRYETFINSAFILQGRADEFTVKTPTDRKGVLAEILDLKQYDVLEERAKDEAKERRTRMVDLDNHIHRLDLELALRPDYVKHLEDVEADLIAKQAEHTGLKDELHTLQARLQELHGIENRLRELEEQLSTRTSDIDNVQVRIYQAAARKGELETLLADRDEIESGYAAWTEAVAAERRFIESRDALRRLENERDRLLGQIDVERTRLSGEARQHERQVRDYERALAGRDQMERNLAEVMDKLRKLGDLQAKHEDTRCQKENLDTKLRALTGEMNALEKDGKQLREKLDMIMATHADGKGHAECPLCGTGLSAEALRRVQQSFDHDITEKRQEYDHRRKEQKTTHDELVEVTALVHEQHEHLKALPLQQQLQAKYTQQLEQLDRDAEKLEKERSQLKTIEAQLATEDYARDHRERLAVVEAQVKSLAYDESAHGAAAQRAESLKGYNDRYHKLDGAGSELATLAAALEDAEKNLKGWTKEQQGISAEIASLQPQVSQLDEVEAQVAVLRSQERELDGRIQHLLGERGELRGKIERCDKLKEEKARVNDALKQAAEEKGIYEELATAFGKKGIQAMIIENVLPELEEEANTLLHRMTDGRMSVQFATQRDGKTTKTVIETLDINISDEVGTRAYELYSGGEAFRVNFAVRIALSKLLARRAGTQLQMLVIDEGFGTQDGQGRDRLVGAIRSIQDDFEKILVVTHLEELKGEFPVRIDIVKTESGSYFSQGDRMPTAFEAAELMAV